MKLYIRAARVPKQITEYVLQGNYGYGWDDLTYHDSYQSAKDDEKAYRENENIPLRIIERKVDNPQYSAASDPMYANLAKKYGNGIKNIIGDDNHLIPRRTYVIETDAINELGGIDDAIYYVIHNPRKLEDSVYIDSQTEKDLGWQEYLDDIREASRNKWDVVSEDTTFGKVPVLVMFNTTTRYSRRDAVYFAVYDI
jgi:hypothetical protein